MLSVAVTYVKVNLFFGPVYYVRFKKKKQKQKTYLDIL